MCIRDRHVLVQVNTTLTEEEICKKAAEFGIRLMGIREHYIHTPPEGRPVLLLGYGKPDEQEIQKGLEVLESIITGRNSNNCKKP